MAAFLLISCLLLASSVPSTLATIPQWCVSCLCEAVSGSRFCVYNGECHDGVCGPYAITLPYWQDAGRPTTGFEDRQSIQTYQKCALDKTCAEATISGYMSKFHQDCNGDGVEDCNDFAAIHFHGGYNCNQPLNVPARNSLRSCIDRQHVITISSTSSPPVDIPSSPQPGELQEEEEDNDIVYPSNTPTFPTIDVRLGD